MSSCNRNERVLRLVQQTFEELGADAAEPPRQTILVRDGYYCGYRFTGEAHQAVWFVEEDQVKFYGPDGSLLCVLTAVAAQADPPAKAA